MIKGKEKRKSKVLKILSLLLLIILCGMIIGTILYVNDYYHAEDEAVEVLTTLKQQKNSVIVQMLEEETIVFIPEEPKAALVFYPSGKVEYTAYVPLMKAFAEQGILCILPHMPCNLAVLDIHLADRFLEMYPNIDNWYIGGHSLGGSMAAGCVAKHRAQYKGLILLAAYSVEDLQDTDLDVISVYGSKDGVLNLDKYREYKSNLPDNLQERVIKGGCHAGFGSYGAQEGDGSPDITGEEQIGETVEFCVEQMLK